MPAWLFWSMVALLVLIYYGHARLAGMSHAVSLSVGIGTAALVVAAGTVLTYL